MAAVGVELPVADRVLVRKSERRLYLMRGNDVLRAYRVSLGLNPGWSRRSAPAISARPRAATGSRAAIRAAISSCRSRFRIRTIRTCRRARRNGWQPGGSIMIHGLPNDPRHAPDYYATQDWTDGCIAVTNADMVEIWMMTSDNVPIDIEP